MATFVENYQKRRLISSYFWVIVSIFLVLFLLGLLGLFILNAKKVSDYFKEQVPISVYFSRSANPTEISQLEKSLSLAEYTKEATFISKETAAENYLAETGENFMEFLGENPLQDMIEVHLNADYVTESQIDEIIAELKTRAYVDDIVYE
ncbi:MAG: permease-like cell division protein FtsX, partial [Flavobacteriaceae bacterium]|nr:permease-like cell division protein FtsX [Flavobacteriaceae bacterium]